jgi:hypothetical protein
LVVSGPVDDELDSLAHDVIIRTGDVRGGMVRLLDPTNMVQDLNKTKVTRVCIRSTLPQM